ncbi:MAG TPA: hypothetical protein VIM00_07970 [Candidatus Acidoferrum sp.]
MINQPFRCTFLASFVALLSLATTLFAQTAGDKVLVVNGRTASTPVRMINGRTYIDIESLAQATNAVFTVENHRVLLTIPPQETTATSGSSAANTPYQQRFSREFSSAVIAELAQLREWAVAETAMMKYGLAVSDGWVAAYREQSLVGLRQAEVAASSESDRNALGVLRSAVGLLTTWADGIAATRRALNGATTVDPNAVQNDQSLAKIRSCGQFLNSMIVSGTFSDDPSCH